jgi:hypothetical protein
MVNVMYFTVGNNAHNNDQAKFSERMLCQA